MISWRDVAVAFYGVDVVGPVTLSVADGEWVGLVGPNGAGKSTLLKAAVGILPHRGVVDLGGQERRAGSDIAWLPQRPLLPDEMHVANYVLLGRTPHLGYLGTESGHDLEAARHAIERLDLVDLSDRPLSTLSGGEAQRAVLARALAQEAPVLLLDEPTSALDVGHQQQVLELIDQLRVEDGLTVVSALHDLTLAGQYPDRVVMMSKGVVVSDGTARQVLTEERIMEHYDAKVKVVDGGAEGVSIIPLRGEAKMPARNVENTSR
jgi:iron complex transport system ATP-binding protein